MGENGSTVATYVFRGIEYVVTVTVEDGRSLLVEVEDRMTADQWCGSFDVDYIEDLTHKTGNYKQFPIFVSMLESAITQSSDSVSLDLLTYADLESLRNRKGSSSSMPKQKQTLQSKRYLILTYTVEFDRIHYPLPLQYSGKPDPKVLQDTIRELRKEIKTLKSQGAHGPHSRNKETEKLRREIHLLKQEKEEIQSEFDQFKAEVKHTARGNSAKEIRILKNVVKNLEEDLLKEKSKYQRAANKRNTEHRKLLHEVDELKASERNLRVRVKSLTNELAVLKRGRAKGVNSSASRKDSTSHNHLYRSRTSSQDSISRSRDHSRSSLYSQDRSYSRERSRPRDRSASGDRLRSSRERSWSHDRSHDRSRGSVNSYRSRGSNPSSAGCRNPRFNPTAYIKEKERKKKEAKYSSKRQARANMSGGSNIGRKPSPYASPFSDRSYGSRRPRSRPSSVSSLRSRTSSIESLSDIGVSGFQSDASEGKVWKPTKHSKTNQRTTAWSSPEVSYEKPVKDTDIQIKKVLSSTTDKHIIKRKHVLSDKENIPSDAMENDFVLDRSSEITEIDTRLKRLQQYMKDHMP